MTKRGCLALACVAGVLAACGGSNAPAEAPAGGAPKAEKDPAAKVQDGPVTTSGDEAPPETPSTKQELPCPGKNAKYWNTGLVRSEVVTGDCEINGRKLKAGDRLEFDEEGQMVPAE